MTPRLVFENRPADPGRVALVERTRDLTYRQLADSTDRAAAALLDGRRDLDEARVVFLAPPGIEHVVIRQAIWRAGGIAVPLSPSQAPAEWDYIVGDTGATIVVGDAAAHRPLAAVALARGARFRGADQLRVAASAPLPDVTADRRAMIVYTSGTTGKPKGVVTTHANLEAQTSVLIDAWGWSSGDRVLHVLPLNHVHGIVNVLGCALRVGATCEFLAPFDAETAWRRLTRGGITVFMGVPTMYAKLLAAWEGADSPTRREWSNAGRRLRLMVSGSAALPVSLLERWRAATGHTLLERYGMTEIGMALSNPLEGERRPGSVGVPLPGVEVRLVGEDGAAVGQGQPGEIEIRGPSVFLEYWGRPDATREAFRDGWFRTGDVAVVEDGSYRILGRLSADIIKTGGYKVSALEIEEALREHPGVADCAVVGVPDESWGECVAVALVARAGTAPDVDGLRAWASSRLSAYKLPTRLAVVEELPRNAMGKVEKGRVKALFLPAP